MTSTTNSSQQRAAADLLAGAHDGVGALAIEQPELAVGERGGLLHAGQRLDKVGVDGDRRAGDREVFQRTQRVDAVVGGGRHLAVAEQVVLDPYALGHTGLRDSSPA